eukprot:364614-Chlamydomonas_euryale.AAC.1
MGKEQASGNIGWSHLDGDIGWIAPERRARQMGGSNAPTNINTVFACIRQNPRTHPTDRTLIAAGRTESVGGMGEGEEGGRASTLAAVPEVSSQMEGGHAQDGDGRMHRWK